MSETVSSEHDTVPCQIQTQNMSQHKRSKKHAGNVLALQTKFKVQDESITNKDYEALVAEKGWLSDSVSLLTNSSPMFPTATATDWAIHLSPAEPYAAPISPATA